MAHAATVTGTVNNKTTGKPSAGDSVVLVDVQAGMADAGSATTDAHGHYSLQTPGQGAYLVRVNHQGGTYFIAAPQGSAPGDVNVYDVAAKVDGVGVDADMILAEAGGGTLRIQERYLVRNTSLPPKAQFSSNTFEFVIPQDAILDGASATRPGGLGTNTRPVSLGQRGHYTINIPIQPNLGEKETLFELQYHIPYGGKYTFSPQPQMPTDNLVVYVPKGMNFAAAKGTAFQPVQEDPRVQTFAMKAVHPGQGVAFTVSGEGQMPREAQQAAGGPQMGGGQMGGGGSAGADLGTEASGLGGRPGGGIGNPIDTPDPLSKYKWWLLGLMALLLAGAAAILLRRQGVGLAAALPGMPAPPRTDAAEAGSSSAIHAVPAAAGGPTPPAAQSVTPSAGNANLLDSLKDELFAIESDKLNGKLSAAEYAQVKAGLEALLKRALTKS